MLVRSRWLAPAALALALLSSCGSGDTVDGSAADPVSPTRSASSTQPSSTGPSESSATDPVSITRYDAGFTVGPRGDLAAVETLTIDVPVDDRHGIYRTFAADVRVGHFTATLDGDATPVDRTVEQGETTFRVGDPDRTVAVGAHVVRMTYDVPDVLTDRGTRGRRLTWALIPDGWTMEVAAAHLTVDLPATARSATCTSGSDPCDVAGVGTRTLTVTTGHLPDHTAVLLEAVLGPR